MKKYNLSNKSDMRRLQRDLEAKAKDIAENAARSRSYDVECPHCHRSVSISPESPVCPECRKLIRVQLNITYKH